MIKSSQYRQINVKNQNIVLNNQTNEVIINNESGFVLLPAYGINPFMADLEKSPVKLYAYKPAPESGNKVEEAVMSAFASQLIPAFGTLAHLLEHVNHLREFSETIFDDSGRKVEIKTGLTGVLESSININPKDALNPTKAFLPITPFVLPTKPEMSYWKQKREDSSEKEDNEKKKKRVRVKGI